MDDRERKQIDVDHGLMQARWHGWASPVGLGLFILLTAGAVDLIRFAFR
jgi:hypothetical protein